VIRVGNGKVKGLYRSCRKEFLRARGGVEATYREAVRFLGEDLRMCNHLRRTEPWFRLLLGYLRSGRMWGQLNYTEREEIVTALRQWEPQEDQRADA
jgi:hypothetical protein